MHSLALLTFTQRIMTLCTKRRQRAGTISMMRDRPMRSASTAAAAAAASARSNSSVIFAQSPLSLGNWAPAPMKHPPSAVHFRRRWRRRDTYDGRPTTTTTTTPRPPHPRPATADVIMADQLRLPPDVFIGYHVNGPDWKRNGLNRQTESNTFGVWWHVAPQSISLRCQSWYNARIVIGLSALAITSS